MEDNGKRRVLFGYGFAGAKIDDSVKTCALCAYFHVYYTLEWGKLTKEPLGRCALHNAVKGEGERCAAWEAM